MSTLISTEPVRRGSSGRRRSPAGPSATGPTRRAEALSLADIRGRISAANTRLPDARQVERIVHVVRGGK